MKHYLLFCLTLALAACGGGGGDSGGGATPTVTTRLANDSAIVNAGEAVTLAVLSNDTNPALPISISVAPTSGTAEIIANEVRYTTATGFVGADSLSYRDAGGKVAQVSITVNAVPSAAADSFVVIENTPTVLPILANDSDPDGTLSISATSLELGGSPAGELTLQEDALVYTPGASFLGDDTFTYVIRDTNSAASPPATVRINVVPIEETSLQILDLPVPRTGYVATAGTLLSPVQTLEVSPNTVSFLLSLQGTTVGPGPGRLTLVDILTPEGIAPDPDARFYNNCDALLCTLYQPKSEDTNPPRGTWQFRILANATTLSAIDFDQAKLQLALRTGPAPDPAGNAASVITIQPFVTSSIITDVRLADVLGELTQLGERNGFQVEMAVPRRLTEPRFVEVSADFADPDTRDLVLQGEADAVNVFFLESFSGFNNAGRIAIAPGIPGALGDVNNLNGVLINGTLNLNTPSLYARTTAEFAFHEMGHLLGLFHTTERFFGATDIIADTPACTPSEDSNADGEADADECPDGRNIMFWTNDLEQEKDVMSEGQRQLLYRAPIARPAAE